MSDFLDPGRKFLLVPKKGGARPSVAPIEARKPTRTALASQLCESVRSESWLRVLACHVCRRHLVCTLHNRKLFSSVCFRLCHTVSHKLRHLGWG